MNGVTTLYLIRHAEAEGNWKRVFQGHTDGPVSEKGARQLRHLARRFAGVPLDAVYASPLARAVQTAEAVNWQGLPVVTLPELREIDGGDFEGVPFSDLGKVSPAEQHNWDHEPARFQAPNGESMAAVYARMRGAVARIAAAHPGGTVAVVTHGCALRCYCCYASGWPLARLAEIPWCDNTAVTRVEYGGSSLPRVLLLGDNSHLPEADSTLAHQDWWRLAARP